MVEIANDSNFPDTTGDNDLPQITQQQKSGYDDIVVVLDPVGDASQESLNSIATRAIFESPHAIKQRTESIKSKDEQSHLATTEDKSTQDTACRYASSKRGRSTPELLFPASSLPTTSQRDDVPTMNMEANGFTLVTRFQKKQRVVTQENSPRLNKSKTRDRFQDTPKPQRPPQRKKSQKSKVISTSDQPRDATSTKRSGTTTRTKRSGKRSTQAASYAAAASTQSVASIQAPAAPTTSQTYTFPITDTTPARPVCQNKDTCTCATITKLDMAPMAKIPGLKCIFCPHNHQDNTYVSITHWLQHVRQAHPTKLAKQPWMQEYVPEIVYCKKCDAPFHKSVHAGHTKTCNTNPRFAFASRLAIHDFKAAKWQLRVTDNDHTFCTTIPHQFMMWRYQHTCAVTYSHDDVFVTNFQMINDQFAGQIATATRKHGPEASLVESLWKLYFLVHKYLKSPYKPRGAQNASKAPYKIMVSRFRAVSEYRWKFIFQEVKDSTISSHSSFQSYLDTKNEKPAFDAVGHQARWKEHYAASATDIAKNKTKQAQRARRRTQRLLSEGETAKAHDACQGKSTIITEPQTDLLDFDRILPKLRDLESPEAAWDISGKYPDTHVTEDTISKSVQKLKKTAAPGMDGITTMDVRMGFQVSTLQKLLQLFYTNKIPQRIMQYLSGYKLSCFTKPKTPIDGSFRPIGPQSVLYRLAGTVLQRQYTHNHTDAVSPYQMAINTKCGMEAIVLNITAHLEEHPNHFVLLMDIKNGYGEVNRKKLRKYLETENLGHLLGFFDAGYSRDNIVSMAMNGKEAHAGLSDGVTQGDPMGGLYFCIPFGHILTEVNKIYDTEDPSILTMYADDGQALGSITKLKEMVHTLVPLVKEAGFQFADKTQLYTIKQENFQANHTIISEIETTLGAGKLELRASDMIDTAKQGVTVLGCPIGSPEDLELATFNASLSRQCGGLGLTKAVHARQYASLASWSFFLTTKLAAMSGVKNYIRRHLEKPPDAACTSHIVQGLKQRIIQLQSVRDNVNNKRDVASDSLPRTTGDLLNNVYNMGTMGRLVHQSLLNIRLKDLSHDEPRYIRYQDNASGDASIVFRQIPYISQLRIQDRHFKAALSEFLMLPRLELSDLGTCRHHDKEYQIDETHAHTCTQFMKYHTEVHNALVSEIATCAKQLGYQCRMEPIMSENLRGDLLISGFSQTGGRTTHREYLDVTVCNLLAPTNRKHVLLGPGALLDTKEKMKRDKYAVRAQQLQATFRGLAFCDSGRFGKGVYALYNEMFKNHRTKQRYDEEQNLDHDVDGSNFDPKIWTIRGPKQLWLTRLRVKLLVLKEQRIDQYITGLNAQRNADLPSAFV
eukprot:m.214458 g.214458  ORF g.214458 m.214458 type:complete len:1345 (-) comp19071_c1_seq22:305-4339(-)